MTVIVTDSGAAATGALVAGASATGTLVAGAVVGVVVPLQPTSSEKVTRSVQIKAKVLFWVIIFYLLQDRMDSDNGVLLIPS
jgi:hypothetical protein